MIGVIVMDIDISVMQVLKPTFLTPFEGRNLKNKAFFSGIPSLSELHLAVKDHLLARLNRHVRHHSIVNSWRSTSLNCRIEIINNFFWERGL